MRRLKLDRLLCLLCALSAAGCLPDEPPEVLAIAPRGGEGPLVVFDMATRPLPDVPFPNDLLTRPDPTSPTGLRLNLPATAPTAMDRSLRRRLLELDGFGINAPITVRFDAPIDVVSLRGLGRDYAEDPVLLVDLTEGDHFGERIPLDLGRGSFPLVLHTTSAYFERDPRAGESNLLLETVDEDLDGNGALDPLEDSDGDEVLDAPNLFEPDGDPVDDLVDFYELQTDTLLLRPLYPLRPGHTYAVALTQRVRGVDGQPVRSPFPYIHHSRQFSALKRLPEALERHGVSLSAVAFTWAFTAQSATRDLLDLRHGLIGQGPFKSLESLFPPGVTAVAVLKDNGAEEPLLLRSAELQALIDAAGDFLLGGSAVEQAGIRASLEPMDYLVAARFVAPDLLIEDPLVDEDGLIVTYDEGDYVPRPIFRLSAEAQTVEASTATIPLWCAVPKATEAHQAPFPVVFYGHGLGGTGFELVRVAGAFNAHGLAVCAIDAFGHGVSFSEEERAVLEAALAPLGLTAFIEVFSGVRARDVDNDGLPDPGVGVFTVDPFRTRDVLRQGVLDWLQAIRVVQGFDGLKSWPPAQAGGAGALAGDFNGDGVVDFGGPEARYVMTGQGLGGMLASIVGAVAPEVDATAVISGGGGLTDFGLRTTRTEVLSSGMAQALGPHIIGDPPESNFTALRFLLPGEDVPQAAFARLPPLVTGDRVRLINLTSGEARFAMVDGERGFRVSVAADAVRPGRVPPVLARLRNLRRLDTLPPYTLETDEVTAFGDALALEVYDVNGNLKHRVDRIDAEVSHRGLVYPAGAPLVAIESGMGLRRQSPDFRRFLQLYQTAVDPADPLTYARSHFLEPRELVTPSPLVQQGETADSLSPTPGSAPAAPLLVVATAGDPEVPVSGAVALARAAGVIDLEVPLEAQGERTANEVYIDYRVVEGVARLGRYEGGGLFDVDDLSDGSDGLDVPRLDPPLRLTGEGPDGSSVGFRVPLLSASGSHGVSGPRPDLAWDGPSAVLELVAEFLATGSL